MEKIRAFVGHSFAPEDAEVVGRFLTYFRQLQDLLPQFAWDHAEPAEPIELAEKVRRKFSEANTFIAICTRKESAISDTKLSGVLLNSHYKIARATDLESKASDWVTQELGYAMGLGFPVIILQEEGIRRPGGLQGDREFVPFTRLRPELAFGKIVEMLSALTLEGGEVGATRDAPPINPATDAAKVDDGLSLDPQPHWTEKQYRFALMHLVAMDKVDEANKVYAAYTISDWGKEGLRSAELAAHLEFLKILFGKGGSLDRISSLALANPASAKIISTIARTQIQFGNHLAAAEAFERAARIDDAGKSTLYYLGRAAIEFAKAEVMDRAHALIEEIKAKTGADVELGRQLASDIRELVELRKDEEAPVIALERTVELSPDDFDARFSLAYKHSEIGNNELALYHYLKIPAESRTAITWNNLGASYDYFKMPVASVSAYRKAEAMGETLAMSNLGYKFINEGFRDEAKASFDKGFAIPDHHPNIEKGLSYLTTLSDDEAAKQKAALEKVAPKVDFYRKLALAIASPQLASLPTSMESPEGKLSITVVGNDFLAVGVYTRESNRLAGLLSGITEERQYKVEYSGRITGRQIEGAVWRKQTGGPDHQSLLNSLDTKSKVLFFLEEDGSLRAMENPHSQTPSFYTFKNVP
jgi:tetratricopeptide (TPR) repeat protein